MSNNKKVGILGETICKNYLLNMGYNIIDTNYHSRYGEIDIIANDNTFLAFVEVKTRSYNSIVSPVQAVTKSKMIKIIKTAYQFLYNNDFHLQPRFDICEIYIKNDIDSISNRKINYIKNAFNLNSVNNLFNLEDVL